MTHEEALTTCRMALTAFSVKHPTPEFKDCGFYDEDSITEFVRELSEEYDIQLLMEACEKQIPKKPLKRDIFIDTQTYFCPDCGCTVKDYMNFCVDCGSKLDWMDENEMQD